MNMRELKHWPSYTKKKTEKAYAINHVKLLDVTLGFCNQFRTAVQAGGSVGYWPMRMAEKFERVITFEPEKEVLGCLRKNLAGCGNIEVRGEALGVEHRKVDVAIIGFGSHRILPGDDVDMIRLDSLSLTGVDLIQFDIEGSEANALDGAEETVDRCRPVIQVEILNPEKGFDVWGFFERHRYKLRHSFTRDYVFTPQ